MLLYSDGAVEGRPSGENVRTGRLRRLHGEAGPADDLIDRTIHGLTLGRPKCAGTTISSMRTISLSHRSPPACDRGMPDRNGRPPGRRRCRAGFRPNLPQASRSAPACMPIGGSARPRTGRPRRSRSVRCGKESGRTGRVPSAASGGCACGTARRRSGLAMAQPSPRRRCRRRRTSPKPRSTSLRVQPFCSGDVDRLGGDVDRRDAEVVARVVPAVIDKLLRHHRQAVRLLPHRRAGRTKCGCRRRVAPCGRAPAICGSKCAAGSRRTATRRGRRTSLRGNRLDHGVLDPRVAPPACSAAAVPRNRRSRSAPPAPGGGGPGILSGVSQARHCRICWMVGVECVWRELHISPSDSPLAATAAAMRSRGWTRRRLPPPARCPDMPQTTLLAPRPAR